MALEIKKEKVKVHRDNRGALYKSVDNSYVKNKVFGEIYCIDFKGGTPRGDHYHKKTTEYFTSIKGKIDLLLKDTRSGETCRLVLDSEDPVCVRIDPYIAHSVVAPFEGEAILLAYSDRPYDPDDTDTYKYKLSG